jgi:hypothetical protein
VSGITTMLLKCSMKLARAVSLNKPPFSSKEGLGGLGELVYPSRYY